MDTMPSTWWGLRLPQLYKAVTYDMIKAVSENSEKRAGFFQSQGKGVFSVTLHSEMWGETEKPGKMIPRPLLEMTTRAYLTRVRSVVLCQGVIRGLLELRVILFLKFDYLKFT